MDWLCLAKEVGNATNETCKPIILDKLTECYSYIKNYKENATLLKTQYELLTIAKKEIDSRVEREVDNLRVLTEGAKRWLEDVRKLMEEVDEGLMKKPKDDEERKGRDMITCLRRSRCNLCRRYDMSKEAKSKADEIDAIINKKPNDVTEPVSRSDLKSIPNEFLKGLRSRVELMEEILKRLRDDQVDAVGIFGMGAIGKTTLVTEISNHEEIKTMFNKEIIMVEISEAPNIERIQDQIAEKIGLRLDGMHSVEQRRTTLYNRLERVSKILIILDNVWAKLDLNKVGIPKPHVKQNKFCKILVTSREKNVCEAMEISKDNIFEVKPLDYDESKQLFRARIGAKINDDGWKDPQREDMEKKMLNRCGGLPLAIVALADVLKNEESLEAWKHFASELEKPMSNSQAKIRGVHRQAYTILETSYKLMEDENKKRFFLLACLFPLGARIPIEDMMRYGIGLDLFENVDNLIEAMEQANRWVEELKASSLLLEEDDEEYKETHVKIHDVVRASTISLAEQGGDMIMVEGFPRWMSLKSCSKYYAISLMSGSNHSRLNKIHSDKLRILILDQSKPREEFPDTFFQGLNNLMVLVLRGMILRPKLPSSMLNLKSSLTTLIMENCELGDITGIGELTNLVVLILRGSSLDEIPEAIGNLCNLRLLDLINCKIDKGGIAANVLSKLSLLEGLYAIQDFWPLRYNNNDDSKKGENAYYARIAELNNLSFLKVCQLAVAYNDWPIDDDLLQFLNNLDHFFISFGNVLPPVGYSRVLSFGNYDSCSSLVKYNGIRVLLQKTQCLQLYSMEELQHINDDIQQQQEDEAKMQLSNIHHFPHLQHLDVRACLKMQSLSSTPFKAPNLTHLKVYFCESMKYIFMEHDDADHQLNNNVTFPCLKLMDLESLPELKSVTGLIKHSTTINDDLILGHHILFNHKTIFPALEHLYLYDCKKIVQLWEVTCKEMSYYSSFKNLNNLEIYYCEKLESLGSLSIATALVQLKTLSISGCPLLREVISSEELKGPISGDEILPSLERVVLKKCPELKMFISIPREDLKDQLLKLSSLQHLEIDECPEMRSFSSFGPILKAPNLKQFRHNRNNYPVDETTDINSFLQNRQQPK